MRPPGQQLSPVGTGESGTRVLHRTAQQKGVRMDRNAAYEFFTSLGLTVEDNPEDWEELCSLYDLDP